MVKRRYYYGSAHWFADEDAVGFEEAKEASDNLISRLYLIISHEVAGHG